MKEEMGTLQRKNTEEAMFDKVSIVQEEIYLV